MFSLLVKVKRKGQSLRILVTAVFRVPLSMQLWLRAWLTVLAQLARLAPYITHSLLGLLASATPLAARLHSG